MAELLTINNSYLQDFAGIDQMDQNNEPQWLQSQRLAAAERFAALGFPTRHDEEFRFTNVSAIPEIPFKYSKLPASTPAKPDISHFDYPGLDGPQLVFVNGHFSIKHSRLTSFDSNIIISTLCEAIEKHENLIEEHFGKYAQIETQAFAALNMSAAGDGAFIYLPKNSVLDNPIHLLYISDSAKQPIATHPRNLIVASEGSQATIIESYTGMDGQLYFTNAVTEIVCGEKAFVDHYKVQRESKSAYHIATMQVQLTQNANFSSHSIGLGGKLVRNDANAILAGEGIECTLNGVYIAGGEQLIDNHTMIDHAMPHCNSHEVYKGILDGHARGVFNGKIFVRLDAQKTDAKQTNQTLLLSPDAQINTKPQLEIFADDVRCTHGATIGQLSADALFYLCARGIPKEQANALLTYAFASDIVSRIKVDPIRAQLDHALLSERALEGLAE